MTKITHGALTVTNDITEAHHFVSHTAAAQWAKTEPLPTTWRTREVTVEHHGPGAPGRPAHTYTVIHLPGVIDQYVALPDAADAEDILAVCSNCDQWVRISNGNDCVNRCADRNLADRVQETEPGEPDNSDQEPDQLTP